MTTRCKHEMDEGTCAICLGLVDVRRPRLPSAEVRAAQLFDYAASVPEWTRPQVQEHFGWSENLFHETVRELRLILSTDTINLVVNKQGDRHVYKLVGDLDSAMPWATIRLHSVESQLKTIANVAGSIVNATHGNSRDGKRARLIAAQMNILELQLNNINE